VKGAALLAPQRPIPAEAAGRNEILLVTLAVPIRRDASSFAVIAAAESDSVLLLANVIEKPLCLFSAAGYSRVDEERSVSDSLAAAVAAAKARAVLIEQLRVVTPRPIRTVRDVIVRRSPRLVVFGPERRRVRRRLYRRAVRVITDYAPGLVWLPD
jgi:hypothetical protein